MQRSEALKIIQALADGIDPNTGEVFAEGTPYQHPQVVRALLTAARSLERQEPVERRNNRLPARAGRAWDKAESKQLLGAFDTGASIAQLAMRHERTEGSIRARLEKLGKIQPHGTPSDESL